MSEHTDIDQEKSEISAERRRELLRQIREETLAKLTLEARKKLEELPSDMEVCRFLAENGVDVEEVERRIKAAGVDLNRIGLQLPGDDFSNIFRLL